MHHIVSGRWMWIKNDQVFRIKVIIDGKLHRVDADSMSADDFKRALPFARPWVKHSEQSKC
jgi:hypothetical protein